MSDSPFENIPSGLDIAHYFWDETDQRNPGCDGINLFRDGGNYCYLWMEAMVDLDMWHAYLLDVRTSTELRPSGFGETRDYLFLFVGAGARFDVEWHNQPIQFEDETEAHRERFRTGMSWFTQRIEKATEDAENV